MNERAKILADAFNRLSDKNTLHIYSDGYVISIACSAERHLSIREVFKEMYPTFEEARSSDGFLSAFVIPTDVPEGIDKVHPAVAVLTTGYNDHRQSDWHRIDEAVELMRRVAA